MTVSLPAGNTLPRPSRALSWNALSLRVRFFAVAALALCITVLMVVLLQSMLSSREQMQRVRQHELPAQIQSVAARVQAQLNLAIAGSEALANSTLVQSWVARGGPQEEMPTIEAAMARSQQSLKANAVFIAAALPEGVHYYHYEGGKLQARTMTASGSTDSWFFNFAQGKRTYELNLDSNPLSKSLLMFVNYRGDAMASHGPLPAVVAGGGMGMEQLAALIRDNKVGTSGIVMLARADGLVDVHPDAALAGKLNLREQAGFAPLLANNWKLVHEQAQAVVEMQLHGQPYYVAVMYLPDLQRYLIAQMPMEEITQGIAHAQWLTLAAGGALLVLGLAVLFPMASGLLRPLESLRQQIASVTESLDLSTRLHSRDRAEIGGMCTQLNEFLQRLHIAFSSVRQSIDSVHMRAASIAQGNQELSSRTEVQASALEHSASSMEELASSVQQNAANARQARELSHSATEVARQGGGLMTQVVQNMQSIAQSSARIGDIVGVIDSIAFQTNILALNAAVEAARAGEQGRGFAVVASEVRNLAGRSAEAAKEIKLLINASVDKVDEGSAQVTQAGQTMDNIVSSIQRVTDIMGEITAASQEQTSGIEQINRAVNEMDMVTQQNAALVEESTAAAQSMQQQTRDLSQRLSVFRLQHH